MAEAFYIDRLANVGLEIELAGQRIRVFEFTIRDQGYLQSIIRANQPDPMEEAKKMAEGLPEEIANEILRDGWKKHAYYPSPIGSEEGMKVLLSTLEGQQAMLKCALRLSDEEVARLSDRLNLAHFMRIAATALSGREPSSILDDEESSDPKAVTSETAAVESTTTA